GAGIAGRGAETVWMARRLPGRVGLSALADGRQGRSHRALRWSLCPACDSRGVGSVSFLEYGPWLDVVLGGGHAGDAREGAAGCDSWIGGFTGRVLGETFRHSAPDSWFALDRSGLVPGRWWRLVCRGLCGHGSTLH